MMSYLLLSKAPEVGQWRTGRATLIAAAGLSLLCASTPALAEKAPLPTTGTQPRYVTLKSAPVNARGGPGEDYKALWTFQAKGVPLQVVEESDDWRRVCDPEGGLGWVRARALDGTHRRVMRIVGSDLAMRRGPSAEAKVSAVLAARATAQLLGCKGGWCRITVDHATGWVRPDEVWGADDRLQCK
jgi:SH3-like domain-containing protein